MKKSLGTVLLILGIFLAFDGILCGFIVVSEGTAAVVAMLLLAVIGVLLAMLGLRLRFSLRPLKGLLSFVALLFKKKPHRSHLTRPHSGPMSKKELQELQLEQQRAEAYRLSVVNRENAAKEHYRRFLEGEGKLPEGFSTPYNESFDNGFVLLGSPFDAYFSKMRKHEGVDKVYDHSGISDWLYYDGEADEAAVLAIASWAKLHREQDQHFYCRHQVAVVVADHVPLEEAAAKHADVCREAEVFFCKLTSDHSLYDMTEQSEKAIEYITYPNYHDETYADWSFCKVEAE